MLVLLALVVVWAVCGILTVLDVLPAGDPARVDVKKRIIEETDWFRIPYPFQWGIPTVSIGAVLGMLCGVLTSTVESIGDYYACASIIQAPVPPEHAMNRGIFMEGLGCVISAIMGTGNASTSYSHNIGTLSVTKVGSRRVIQIAGVIMVGLGLVGKAGAIFVSLPDPILGGMFLFLFPLVMSVGIGTLSEVNLESSRNIFIVSFSIFFGLAVSQWMNYNPGLIDTGTLELDSLLQILLSTGMFVAGITAFVLDNTVSGTDEERGLTQRQVAIAASKLRNDTTYDLPFGM
ncbi:Solute carrier family 23 member 1, partial [Orchesella cincta]